MLIDKVQPKFVETVEIGTGVLPIAVTREDWTKFIAEVREGKHDWPGEQPESKGGLVVLQLNGADFVHLSPGDSCSVRTPGDYARIKVVSCG